MIGFGVSLIFENHYNIDNDNASYDMMTIDYEYTLFDGATGQNGFLSVGYNSMISTDFNTYPSAAEYITTCARNFVTVDAFNDEIVDIGLLKDEMDFVINKFPSLRDEIDWMDPARVACYSANIYKFDQNPELLVRLLGTNEFIIVFANEDNRGVGIGFSIEDAMVNQLRWGGNMPGGTLMRLRDLYKTEMMK